MGNVEYGRREAMGEGILHVANNTQITAAFGSISSSDHMIPAVDSVSHPERATQTT